MNDETQNTELKQFLQDHPDTSHLDVLIIDLCGNAIGKRLPRQSMGSFFKYGTPVCGAMQLVDVLGNTADPMGYGFSDGDPDAFAVPIENTLVPVPWGGANRSQVLCEFVDYKNQKPLWYEPRQVLKQVVERFAELNLKPVLAVELEFYLIDAELDDSGAPVAARSPFNNRAEAQGKVLSLDKLDEFQSVLSALEQACALQKIPTTTMISEYGAGQFEVNLQHQHDPLIAADHAALLRRCIRAVAREQGYDATFMSKPFADQSGNGLHVHLSLEDEQGNNIFTDSESLLGQAVAGLQATMSEAMAIFAPNLNVYRRFKPDEFVPVTKDWGENNRSVAFRIPPSDAQNRRIEHRVSGAEANPYLVIAAVLAGVHYGLKDQLDAGDKHSGNAGSKVDAELPLTLWQSLDAIRNAKILNDYLSTDYLNIYADVKQAEFDAFMESIFTREYEWYL